MFGRKNALLSSPGASTLSSYSHPPHKQQQQHKTTKHPTNFFLYVNRIFFLVNSGNDLEPRDNNTIWTFFFTKKITTARTLSNNDTYDKTLLMSYSKVTLASAYLEILHCLHKNFNTDHNFLIYK